MQEMVNRCSNIISTLTTAKQYISMDKCSCVSHSKCARCTQIDKINAALLECTHDVYAFWHYDLPPYYNGGKVTAFLKSGRVCVSGYEGYSFTPLTVMIGDRGKAALEKLGELRAYWHAQERLLKDQIQSDANKVLGILDDQST